jgi:hypothetical protein
MSKRGRLIEKLDTRLMFAWSEYAQLIQQDDAAVEFPAIDGRGQTVAVIDSGIDYKHPSLGLTFGRRDSKVIGGYDAIDNDNDPYDRQGHGTAVAGAIAAERFYFNGVTYQGIAPKAKLVGLRIHRSGGIWQQQVKAALKWVIDNASRLNISVVNMSIAFETTDTAVADGFASAEMRKLKEMNIVVVSGAGNDGVVGVGYPSSDVNSLSVGAVRPDGEVSDFSQRGRLLDVVAPGEDVVLPLLSDSYEFTQGTSFASPLVAGLAALIKQINPRFTADEVAHIMRASADSVTDNAFPQYSYGRVNVLSAIKMARAMAAPSSTLAGSSNEALATTVDAYGMQYMVYDRFGSTQFTTRRADGTYNAPTELALPSQNGSDFTGIAITIDQTGKPVVALYEQITGDLYLARFNGTEFEYEAVDSAGDVGQNPSMITTAAGNVWISYYDRTNQDLKYARRDRDTGTWSIARLDSAGNVGRSSSLAYWVGRPASVFDPIPETIGIAYSDDTNGNLKYAQAMNNGRFRVNTLDNLNGVSGIDLNLDNNRPVISYQDSTLEDVKLAYVSSRGRWLYANVATVGAVGRTTNVFYDSAGRLTIAYHVDSNDGIFYARQSRRGNWNSIKLADAGGMSFAVAERQGANSYILYYDPRRNSIVGELVVI